MHIWMMYVTHMNILSLFLSLSLCFPLFCLTHTNKHTHYLMYTEQSLSRNRISLHISMIYVTHMNNLSLFLSFALSFSRSLSLSLSLPLFPALLSGTHLETHTLLDVRRAIFETQSYFLALLDDLCHAYECSLSLSLSLSPTSSLSCLTRTTHTHYLMYGEQSLRRNRTSLHIFCMNPTSSYVSCPPCAMFLCFFWEVIVCMKSRHILNDSDEFVCLSCSLCTMFQTIFCKESRLFLYGFNKFVGLLPPTRTC